MASSAVDIPHPSPESKKRRSISAVDESPADVAPSWYHIISVAFLETLESRLFNTPSATESNESVEERWNKLCEERGIKSTPLDFEAGDLDEEDSTAEDITTADETTTMLSTSQPVKRGRGRPRRQPAAIVAAKTTLRKIGEMSDRQWAAVQYIPQSNDSVQAPRGRGRPRKIKPTEPSTNPPAAEQPEASTANNEPEVPEVPLEISISPPARTRKPLKPSQVSSSSETPTIRFYFTLLPQKPKPAKSSSFFTSAFSFRLTSKSRTLTSDKLVMLCTRARVRQNRLKERNQVKFQPTFPHPWLLRNLKKMQKVRKNLKPVVEDIEPTQEETTDSCSSAKRKVDETAEVGAGSGPSAKRRSQRKKRKTI